MTILLVAGIFILTVVFIYQEIKTNSPRRWLNVLIKGVIILCLALLFLRNTSKSPEHVEIILTKGYSKQVLDSIKNLYPDAYIHDSETSLPKSKVNHLFILGVGLDNKEKGILKAEKATFIPPEINGLYSLNYTDRVNAGGMIEIAGESVGDRVVIAPPWDKADSLNNSFQWQINAPAPGNYLISIDELQLPVEVLPNNKNRILIMTKQPDFRTRFLKEFLAEEGNEVLWQAQLSKGIIHKQWLNNENLPFRLTEDNLNTYNLLIADPETLQNLSSSEENLLKKSIQDGLGLLILPYEGYEDIFTEWFGQKMYSKMVESDSKIQKLHFQYGYSPLMVELRTEQAMFKYYGQGKIGSLKLLNEYLWQLSGQNEKYTELWTDIIQKLSRNHEEILVKVNTFPPLVDHRVDLSIMILDDERPELEISDVKIPLRQDLYWSNRWHGSYWPVDTGWHEVKVNNEITSYLYVQKELPYYDLIYADVIKDNKDYWSALQATAEAKVQNDYVGLILLLLILSFAYLWLEPKL